MRKSALAFGLCLTMWLSPLLAPARAYTDDYPWKTATTNSIDWFGFTKRQCVSYAAWRLYKAGRRINNRTVHNGKTYYWGNAWNWDNTAVALGKRVSRTPRVGSVAHWNAYETSRWMVSGSWGGFKAGGYGHVAWVAYVYSDGSVLLRQYNVGGSRAFSQARAYAPRYLYI